MKPLTRCPLCGSRKVHRVRKTVLFNVRKNPIRVPKVTFDHCSDCGEKFFDPKACDRIDRFVASLKHGRTPRKSA
jgi:YgiT-type zinc finger domain-containing protein